MLTRAPGINQQMTALLQACIAYGIAWVFTLIAALILVKNGAFDWLPARYAVVIALHLAGGAVGLMGAMGFSEWWILPCVAFATVVPLLVQSAALNASFRPVLLVVIALQAVAVVAAPAGYFVRVTMKEREHAARLLARRESHETMLVEALRNFEGTMLFVSHDRTFLKGLSNRVLELRPGDGNGAPGLPPFAYGGSYVEFVERTGSEAAGVHR